MSGLWDYDDEDLDDDGDWGVQPQGEVVEDETPGKKRKPGRKPGRAKKQAVAPAKTGTDLQHAQRPVAILLDDSDDDDDIVVLASPVGSARPAGPSGTSGQAQAVMATPVGTGPSSKAVANLNPETQKSLAKEQELLRALQKATELQLPPFEDQDPGPVHTAPRLRPLGLSSLANAGGRLPIEPLSRGAGAGALGSDGGTIAKVVEEAEGPSVAPAAVGSHGESIDLADEDDAAAAATATAATQALAEDRILLKLVWAGGKDGHLMMRVVKTDPISKMMEKFREIAKQRGLSKDPNKIRFMFDGEDLGKTPNLTPEDLDLEDDVIIDVKGL